jgi:SsrA-binding protein
MASPTRSNAGHRKQDGTQVVASNRKARHDFTILDTLECGIVLKGAEVKTLREGTIRIAEAFARIDGGELWIHGMHIPPYPMATGFGKVDPDRSRKLLAHRDEIERFGARAAQEHLTLVPLSVYFKDGRAKVEIALAKGRKTIDKRRLMAERTLADEARRAMGRSAKGFDD